VPHKPATEPALARYRAKRDFTATPEPGPAEAATAGWSYVIQKHAATRLHYDFRLELDGVLVSWAVPKGPCFDPRERRMAVHTEDHPVAYGAFEGTIPPRQYGAGEVIIWDRGRWEPVGDARAGLAQGKLAFRLHGEKLAGLWELVRIRKPGDRQDPWILFKKKDEWAQPLADYDVVSALPDSVVKKPLGLLEGRDARGAARAAALPATAGPIDPARLEGAMRAPLPARLGPQLATLARSVPEGPWLVEIKFDGYRVMARIEEGRARLITRGGHDWTDRMPSLARAIEALGVPEGWLDGEIVVLDANGTPNFNALQNAFDSAHTDDIRCFLFDLPFAFGHDLRRVPLHARRALLKQIVDAHPHERVRYSEDFPADPASVLETARRLGLEGVIAKRRDAPYVSARTDTWLKIKSALRQEFVIGGYTERSGGPGEIGSLHLGVFDAAGRFVYAGNVGTGWGSQHGRDVRRRLEALEADEPPFEGGAPTGRGRWSRRSGVVEHWVRPEAVCEVSFSEWTPDGHVRHAVFQGLRDDKPARDVRREDARAAGVASPGAPRAPAASATRVSNPERVIDPSTGLKKLDLVRYYESVADWILPHLRDRPVSLVRGPNGIGGELFFQKHGDTLAIPGITELDPKLWPGHDALLAISNAQALAGAAQMNVIELHTWNSTVAHIDEPDRVVFDLDPGEGVGWPQLQEAALLTRTLLEGLELESWLKTSGGKGLHLVVPLVPRLGYDAVNAFARAAVEHLARTIPQRFVAKAGAGNRKGRIFVDWMRNGHGATTVSAYSARARPGLGVSMPLRWDDLHALKGAAQWTIANAREHLSFLRADPWAAYFSSRQTLGAALRILGVDAPKGRRRTR
jgi:bifunctional non-homologous end joining protein LigD